MRISKNFTMAEFAVSETARKAGITFTVPANLQPNVVALVTNLLQPLCDATGWKDKVNSGYRPDNVNKMVGGVPTSQHRTAEAADNMFYEVDASGKFKRWVTPIEVLRKVLELKLPFDQMIAYNGFVHLSYTTKRANRGQVLYNKGYTGAKLK